MKEMIVSVEQTEGIVNISNFEEIKANVQASMELYKSMTFTEDTLSEAKSTVQIIWENCRYTVGLKIKTVRRRMGMTTW